MAYPELAVQQGQVKPYEGKVWFLIDGKNFSATAWFCSVARSHHRGTFVGEETGGGYYGNSGVEFTAFPLRSTRTAFTIPLLRVRLAVADGVPDGRGVVPDVPYRAPVDSTPERDSELDFVLRTISKQRTR
jgi:C-terminal processing protease CtpA/Prc